MSNLFKLVYTSPSGEVRHAELESEQELEDSVSILQARGVRYHDYQVSSNGNHISLDDLRYDEDNRQ